MDICGRLDVLSEQANGRRHHELCGEEDLEFCKSHLNINGTHIFFRIIDIHINKGVPVFPTPLVPRTIIRIGRGFVVNPNLANEDFGDVEFILLLFFFRFCLFVNTINVYKRFCFR